MTMGGHMSTHNRLKARLGEGHLCRGVWLALADASIAEIAGHAGFDWCMIDGEHGPNTLSTMAAQLRALAATPAEACLRVPVNEPWIIKQVLDLGLRNILIPMVHDGAAARAAVAACRYPPDGVRGVGAALARASGYGADRSYFDRARDALCIMVQAESRSAVDSIDDIAGTEGVDVVFIGPADLAADMGHGTDMAHPEVTRAIDHIIARCAVAGKPVGTVVFDPEVARAMADRGVRFLGVGGDAAALRAGFSTMLNATA